MDTKKVVVGAILILVAVWMFFSLDNATARYLGGGIVAIIGLAVLIPGLKKGGTKPPQELQEPQAPQPPQQPGQ